MSQYPLNDLRNPLGKAFYDLTQQVEALGGSPELTNVVVAIGALRDQVGAALASKPLPEQVAQDSLQGAADWLFSALNKCDEGDLQRSLLIGYNRAKRLLDAARTRGEGGGV